MSSEGSYLNTREDLRWRFRGTRTVRAGRACCFGGWRSGGSSYTPGTVTGCWGASGCGFGSLLLLEGCNIIFRFCLTRLKERVTKILSFFSRFSRSTITFYNWFKSNLFQNEIVCYVQNFGLILFYLKGFRFTESSRVVESYKEKSFSQLHIKLMWPTQYYNQTKNTHSGIWTQNFNVNFRNLMKIFEYQILYP